MRLALAFLAVAACGDDGATMVPGDGGGSDANVVSPTIAVEFAAIPTVIATPTTAHVKGPDGRIYALRGAEVVASSDGGGSFSHVGGTTGSSLVATSASLFSLGQGPVRLIRFANGDGLQSLLTAPADALFMAATPTTLWIESIVDGGSSAPKLFRSIDQGDSFTEVTLPPPPFNNRWNLRTGGEYLVLESNGRVYRTQTGATWEDLGTIAMLQSIAVTQAGTALAYGTITNYALYRRTITDSAWATAPQTTGVFTISQRENGELVRVNTYTGAIELSTSDGASWTTGPASSLTGCNVLEHHAFDAAILGTCFDTATTLNIRLPAAASQWIREEPDGLPYPQLANFTDVSFSDSGKIVLSGKKRLYISDNGTSWRRSAYAPDSTWPINAVAMSPSGSRIYAGSTLGRYAFLDGDGTVTIGPSAFSPSDDEAVRQADWMSERAVFVTTASTDNTAGTVRVGDPDGVGIWDPINPYARESNPQFDPTAGFHGIAACPFNGGHALMIGVHQWFGTNSYQTNLRIKYQYGSFDPFMDLEPPVSPFIASSLSCAPNGTQSWTFGNEFLYVGSFLGAKFQRVEPTGLDGGLVVAKFAPDNRLWVITDRGVFRSTAPVDAH